MKYEVYFILETAITRYMHACMEACNPAMVVYIHVRVQLLGKNLL